VYDVQERAREVRACAFGCRRSGRRRRLDGLDGVAQRLLQVRTIKVSCRMALTAYIQGRSGTIKHTTYVHDTCAVASHACRRTRSSNVVVVEVLLKAGANLNLRDQDSWTAVHFATKFNHVDTLEKLLEVRCCARYARRMYFTPFDCV
jgi:hypothetical protein